MACFAFCKDDWDIKLTNHKIVNKVIYYDITIRFGNIAWKVYRRYSDFVQLSNQLALDHGFSKDSMPPKKLQLFGLPTEEFINERKDGLENFLKTSFNLLKTTMPRSLVTFLHINKYEIFYILEALSIELNSRNPWFPVGQLDGPFRFSYLQVYALSKILKLPRPPVDIYGLRLDYCDILELCSKMEFLQIEGCKNYLYSSNLVEADLEFDLLVFKSIKQLVLKDINVRNLNNASNLRQNLTEVTLWGCKMKSLSEFLICDQIHKDPVSHQESNTWEKLIEAHFYFNSNLHDLDKSIVLMPRLRKLDLVNNKLENVCNIKYLKELQHLNVSNNLLTNLEEFSFCSNLVSLDVSGNKIISLKGLECLNNLTALNVSFNSIDNIEELKYVIKIPLLENFVLTGNPITSIIDYRIKILSEFGNAHRRIILDNEESTEKELDTVAVLQALRSVKEGNPPVLL